MEDETVNNIICQFTDPEGTPLKAPLYIPQNAGPRQIVNKLLNNEEKLPYAFSTSDQELVVPLETYSQKSNGHAEAVLSVAFSPDGRQLAIGSGDTTVHLWDLNTQIPSFFINMGVGQFMHNSTNFIGHKNWVLCTAWSPDGKHLVSGSKAGELQCWAPQAGKPSGNPLVVKSLTIRLADILAIYTDRGNPMQLKNQL